MEPSWSKTASRVQQYRAQGLQQVQPPLPELPSNLPQDVTSIPQQLLSPRELEITQFPPQCLLSLLAVGDVSSVEVTRAYLRRAALAQQLVNCITELLPEQALTRARELDRHMEEKQRPMGPLHGLPISVKEHIGMKGLTCNAGFVAWADEVATDDALILKLLWKAGCVFYVRTTEPQTLMHLETSSNLYGETVNPYNRDLTSGGSSGGEGALLGLHGSCLGIGSDIGGSIRSPAAHNGLYGFRPTTRRIPKAGSSSAQNGGSYIDGILGPMSTSLEGIEFFMKTVLAAKPWMMDPTLVAMPWRNSERLVDQLHGKTIKIGVMWSDGVVTPHPSVTRALTIMVERLKKVKNVELVEWKPFKHRLAWEIIARLYYIDGGKQTADLINSSGEPWRPLSAFICKDSPYVRDRSVADIQKLVRKRDNYRIQYAEKWNATATGEAENGEMQGMMDVIICPAGPGPAPPLDCSKYWNYTSQWNLLDYPALVFPVTRVEATVDSCSDEYAAINKQDKFNYDMYLSVEDFEGMPIGLQLVGRPFEDEKVLRIMRFLRSETENFQDTRSDLRRSSLEEKVPVDER